MIIEDKIKQIKYARLKPEELWLIKILTNVKSSTSVGSSMIFYKLDGEKLFQYCRDNNRNIIYCSYDNIWFVLLNNYKLTREECRVIFNKLITRYLDINDENLEFLAF